MKCLIPTIYLMDHLKRLSLKYVTGGARAPQVALDDGLKNDARRKKCPQPFVAGVLAGNYRLLTPTPRTNYLLDSHAIL